jgi:hypothetical protein
VPVSITSRATVRLFGVPRVRPPVLGLGIYFLYFVYFSLLCARPDMGGLKQPSDLLYRVTCGRPELRYGRCARLPGHR